MNELTELLFPKGANWNWWKLVGWAGNAIFFSRFVVQWYATEKKKQVVVPVTFWWLSLVGSLLLLFYAVVDRDPIFIVAYAANWIPYIRNLIIHRRHLRAHKNCPSCNFLAGPSANFCEACGSAL